MLTGNTHDDFVRLEKRIRKLERGGSRSPEAWIPMDDATYLGAGWLGDTTQAYRPRYYKDRERVYLKGGIRYTSGGSPSDPIKFMPVGYRIAATGNIGGGEEAVLIPWSDRGLVSPPDGSNPLLDAGAYGGPRVLDLGFTTGLMRIILGGFVPNDSYWWLNLISYRIATFDD